MPPQLALTICISFVCFALLLDAKRTPNVSASNWIAVMWVTILASRPIISWFEPSGGVLGNDPAEGSAIDRNLLSTLMLLAIVMLVRRSFQVGQWMRENPSIVALFLYAAISLLWSDFPLVALKRLVRALGGIVIVMLVMSEKDPVAAIAATIRRSTYILIPFSVVLVKYYRDLGVGHNFWTGAEFLTGVTTDKNALGRLCLIAGLFAAWEFTTIKNSHIYLKGMSRLVRAVVFGFTLWLLVACNSATSLTCFIVGTAVLMSLGLSPVRSIARYAGTVILLLAPLLIGLSLALDLPETMVTSLGRDMTLTERTDIWHALLAMQTNPVLGVGYDSFWLGERLATLGYAYNVNEAHNGYLEVYLELGVLGVILFACIILSMLRKSERSLSIDIAFGKLQMAILVVFVLYNVTEAGYKATSFIFFVLLIVAVESPAVHKVKISPGERERAQAPPNKAALPL